MYFLEDFDTGVIDDYVAGDMSPLADPEVLGDAPFVPANVADTSSDGGFWTRGLDEELPLLGSSIEYPIEYETEDDERDEIFDADGISEVLLGSENDYRQTKKKK